MKHFAPILIVLFGLSSFIHPLRGQSAEEALSYMEKLSDAMEKPKRDTWRYLKAVTRSKRAKKIERKRENLLEELVDAKNTVRKMGKFHSDDTLRTAVITYLDLNYTVLKEDFDKIMDMKAIAEQSYDKMEAYLKAKEVANDKMNNAFEKVVKAQESFADKYGINLQEGEQDRLSRKISSANKVLKYYNKVYLIFFKAYKQEAYVLDAMERKDMISMEQNNNSLNTFAKEGLRKLEDIEPYKGDNSLITGATRILRFYKKESENEFASMTDFYIKKDNYEKIKKNFDSKSRSGRTKQDIKQYNKAVKEYNRAAKKANRILKSGNKKREKFLKNWNETVEDFFDEHS